MAAGAPALEAPPDIDRLIERRTEFLSGCPTPERRCDSPGQEPKPINHPPVPVGSFHPWPHAPRVILAKGLAFCALAVKRLSQERAWVRTGWWGPWCTPPCVWRGARPAFFRRKGFGTKAVLT